MTIFEHRILTGEPVMLSTMSAEFTIHDQPASDAAARAVLDSAAEPVFVILDLRMVSFTINSLIRGVNMATRGEGAVLRHPNVRQVIMVSANPAISLAAKGMADPAFGSVPTIAVDTLDDAFAYVHDMINSQE